MEACDLNHLLCLSDSPTWDLREFSLRLSVIESRTNIMADVSKGMEVSEEIISDAFRVGTQKDLYLQ